MDFRHYVRQTVGKQAVGLEFGASYNPIVPKAEGYNVFVVDHADQEELRTKYAGHPVDINRIEPVDAIDDGGELTNLLPDGQLFDYIIASHVFEHLPDPIGFLQRCERSLKPEGKLFLMIPDRRFTFDYFRPVSSTGDLLRSFLEGRTRHDPGNLYDHYSSSAVRNGIYVWGDLGGGTFTFSGELQAGYASAVATQENYVDCHAWVFTPSSFRRITDELRSLGLTKLGELEFYNSVGCEFFTVLSVSAPATSVDRVARAKAILVEATEGLDPPSAPTPEPAMNFDDAYERRAPTAQNAVDAMGGTWVAQFPGELQLQAGSIALHSDARISWLIDQIGGVAGLDILELGPLEASHTAMLLEAQAKSVLAIEANRVAYLKCLVVKEIRKLDRASFLLGDLNQFLNQDERSWPLIVASGVLYHMERPLELLESLAKKTDRLFLWTHVVDDAHMPANDPRWAAITERVPRKWHDKDIVHYLRPYGSVSDPKFCGGLAPTPAWLSRTDLLGALQTLGFDDIRIAHEAGDAAAGPSLSVLATRRRQD